MTKPKYLPVTTNPEAPDPLIDRYFLYIDILGFADLVESAPSRVADLYEVISTLNAHQHQSFGTIVFSDTILIYPKFEAGMGERADAYFIMYLCEFAQDLLYRLRNRDIYFRAVLTQGKFTHYFLDAIPCFYGSALIDAYRSEKKIKAIGLFMDRRCSPHNQIFRTGAFNDRFEFVYLWQSLEEFTPHGIYEFPYPDASIFSDTDLPWKLAEDAVILENIARNRNSTDRAISEKHSNTWKLVYARYPAILRELEKANFHPRVFCPKLDWTEYITRARALD